MIKYFVIYNASGDILRTGSCPGDDLHLQAQEGELLVEATACCLKDAVDPQTGEIIVNGRQTPVEQFNPPPAPAPSLPATLQLDLLWQAMDSGTFPKAEPFYSAIKAAKEAQA